jgi:hypothetical protein
MEIFSALHPFFDICFLAKPTLSQSHTVATAIKNQKIEGAIFVKDCDNMFSVDWSGGNEVSVIDLNKVGLVDAKNKSYVMVGGIDTISNIVEKQIISNLFCCGGYGFDSASNFVKHFETINQPKEVYISHIIYSMIMVGERFHVKRADNYTDWGTKREYRNYCNSFVTIFCDIDGVLMYNGSKFGENGWRTEPIKENLATISQLQKLGRIHLIATSCRLETEIEYLKEQLAKFGVKIDRYIMGLPHSRRIIVNDFSPSNPYPSAMAINLERDGKLLSDIIDSVSGQ